MVVIVNVQSAHFIFVSPRLWMESLTLLDVGLVDLFKVAEHRGVEALYHAELCYLVLLDLFVKSFNSFFPSVLWFNFIAYWTF